MIKYLLFDLDGTITDPKEGITKCVQYALSKFDIEEECDNLLSFIGPPLTDSFMDFYGFDKQKAELAIKYYRERYAKIGLFENSAIDGIHEVLEKLKNSGYTLAVATSKPTCFAISICEKYDFSKYFDIIMGSELDGTRTKKSEIIYEVLKQLNANPEETIMIGDRKYDIIGAKEVGTASIGVRFGYAEDGELEKAGADFIVGTPNELLTCILEMKN